MTTITELPFTNWPYLPILERIGLALSLGFFVGLERERRHKEAGLRTFAFVALLGSLGGLLGEAYALLSLCLVGVLVVFLNLQTLRSDQKTELTTSAALLVTAFAGILCGKGHTLTPAAVGVITAALLAWKERLAGFSTGLSENEVRSAIVLAIFAFVIFPALPQGAVGPLDLIVPRQAWITVIIIAGLGFINYILWRLYGDRGVELTGFLGGLVNSTVTVGELARRVRETKGALIDLSYRAILFATGAMLIRNAILLLLLDPWVLGQAAPALVVMLVVCGMLVFRHQKPEPPADGSKPLSVKLNSPFSIIAVLKYGLLFLAIQIAGTLAQRFWGQAGVYATSVIGGLLSSASAVAAVGNLAAQGDITNAVAGRAAVIASLMSVLSNFPFVIRSDKGLLKRMMSATILIVVSGLVGLLLEAYTSFHLSH